MTVLEEDENEELGRILRRLLVKLAGGRGYVAVLEAIHDPEDPVGPSLTVDGSIELEEHELVLVRRVLDS